MKLVSLNICNGGGERMPAIERYLAATGADVIVLPEYRQHRPPHLDGFSIFDASTIAKNAVAVAVRGNAERVELLPADADRHRIVGIRYCGITIVGLYFAQNQAKASLFDYLITAPFKEPTLLVGDFNTGLALDAEGTPFHCGDLFERLSERSTKSCTLRIRATGASRMRRRTVTPSPIRKAPVDGRSGRRRDLSTTTRSRLVNRAGRSISR